ncbi:MAG: hypothetical protein HQ557_01870 [Bacteroidetes bacterium]|nr:hypothetical protein [Bacteroidota bacterium]
MRDNSAFFEKIGRIVQNLSFRASIHDYSKLLNKTEFDCFSEHGLKLSQTTWGTPEWDELIKIIEPVTEQHYSVNRHHVEYFSDGISGMDAIDVIELFADWFARSGGDVSEDLMEKWLKTYHLSNQFGSVAYRSLRLLRDGLADLPVSNYLKVNQEEVGSGSGFVSHEGWTHLSDLLLHKQEVSQYIGTMIHALITQAMQQRTPELIKYTPYERLETGGEGMQIIDMIIVVLYWDVSYGLDAAKEMVNSQFPDQGYSQQIVSVLLHSLDRFSAF